MPGSPSLLRRLGAQLRRRPLQALIVLILLLAVGYASRAVAGDDHRTPPRPVPSTTR